MKKDIVLKHLIDKLETEEKLIEQAALASHEAATHEESRSEDRHDTRGLEASYLAGAQKARLAEIHALITFYKFFQPKNFLPTGSIESGALIELSKNDSKSLYFLSEKGGAIDLVIDKKPIKVIHTLSPMGEALLGKKIGDDIEFEVNDHIFEFNISGLW